MTIILVAVFIGIVAGLRSMTAPAAVSWAAHLGRLPVAGTWLAFMGSTYTPWILTLFAVGELVADQLPKTPSRKKPGPFIGRLLTGGLSGAAVGTIAGSWLTGLIAGVVGAVIGTLGGAEMRGRLATMFKKDRPAALLEDAIAIGGAALLMAIV